ncbi:MAG: hypothetical protein F6J96_01735 [Symploca sp. SIO1C2]|nr:hypothetical protein [Symploca sp. SIO1C2]
MGRQGSNSQITNDQQQTTNNQQPTTNNKQQTTNNQQQTTNNKQQITILNLNWVLHSPRPWYTQKTASVWA